MTDISPAAAGVINSHAAGQALHETRELRRKQDDELQRRRRIVAGTFALYVSTVAITISASPGVLKPLTAVSLLFGGAFILLLTALMVEITALNWTDGPTTSFLEDLPRSSASPHGADLLLTKQHNKDHRHNEKRLLWVTAATAFHVMAAVGLVAFTIAALLAAVRDSNDPAEPPIETEQQDTLPSGEG